MSPPKRTRIKGQKHELAYINKDEKALLRSRGGGVTKGGGQLKKNGVNAYAPGAANSGNPGQASAAAAAGAAAAAAAAANATSVANSLSNNFSYGLGQQAAVSAQSHSRNGPSATPGPNIPPIRRDDDIATVAKGDTTGTGLSSSSTAQPVSPEAAAVKRRQAKDANQGLSGIDEREVIGLAG